MSSPSSTNPTEPTDEPSVQDLLQQLLSKGMDLSAIQESLDAEKEDVEKITREEKLTEWKIQNKYISPEDNDNKLKSLVSIDTKNMKQKALAQQIALIKECVYYVEIEIPAEFLPKVPKKKSGVKKLDKSGKPIDKDFNYTDPEKCKTNYFCKHSNGKDGTPKQPKETHNGCGKIYKNKVKRDEHSAKCNWAKKYKE